MKTKLILVVVSILLSYIGIGYFVHNEMTETDSVIADYKVRQGVRDSIVSGYKELLVKQQREADSLIIGLKLSRDTTNILLTHIKQLTRPRVTTEVIEESLLWIEQYNSPSSH